MELLVVKNSIWKNGIFLFGSMIFVSLGYFILSVSNDLFRILIGWTCILFFGLGVLVFLKRIFDTRPRIVIDRFGIFDRTIKIGIIEWQDIQYASLSSVLGNDFISLVLMDDEKYLRKANKPLSKLSKFNKNLGFDTININLSGTNVKSQEVFDLIIKQLTATKIKRLKNRNFELELHRSEQKNVVSNRSSDSQA